MIASTMKRIRCCVLILLCLAVTAWGQASDTRQESLHARGLAMSSELDWPQWRGPYRDGISDETDLLTTWPVQGPPLLWQVSDLSKGWSSPIIIGGRIYITGDAGGDLIIYALDHKGKIVWQVKNGRPWKNPYPGARATCAYSEGRLYHLNAHGRLVCLNAKSGREQWTVNILERFDADNITWALSECLLIDGPRVIVTPGGRKALMAALDKKTGQTVWTTPALQKDSASHSSPILFEWGGRRVIANCSSAHGFGVDADSGELLWTVPLKNPHGVNAATPVYSDGCIFFSTPYAELGRLYGLDASNNTMTAHERWRHPVDAVTGGSLLVKGTLYAAGYRKPKWWFALDWQTGETRYEYRDLTTGAALYADQHLYCLDEKGTVALLKPQANGLALKGRFSLKITETVKIKDAWAHPVVCKGRLYIRYHDTLWCYDVQE